jgi:hypothetical protein
MKKKRKSKKRNGSLNGNFILLKIYVTFKASEINHGVLEVHLLEPQRHHVLRKHHRTTGSRINAGSL